MASPKWQSRERDYSQELKSISMQQDAVTNHPLKISVVVSTTVDTKSGKKKKTYEHGIIDPLSKSQSSEASDTIDPLSMFAAESATTVTKKSAGGSSANKDDIEHFILDDVALEPWSSKRLGILSKYTTSEKLSITTSFLSDTDRVVMKQQTTVSDKVKHRIGQLDDIEEGSIKEMLNLSQQEFVRRIEQLNQELIAAWENEQKVKALKIAIQCAKMLASVAVIGFYPSKFVLITDVLDTFGRLVYERLLRKSATIVPGTKLMKMLPDNFSPEDVTDVAKETCRNWFYKIASIRELIPRFYVETSILKCYRFLTTGEYDNALVRLTKMIRGIGDPLVATYARCYICRVGILVAPDAKSHLRGSLLDFFFTYKQLQTDTVQNILAKQNTAPTDYLRLYTPALDWIIQCIAFKSPEEVLTEILNHCTKECNSALILNSIMSAFRPSYISARALEFVKIISDCEDAGFPKYQLYRSLGMNVVLDEPPEAQRLQLLNDVWKVVMKLNSPEEYISCAEIWVEYPIKYFGKREIDTLLGDILKHLNVDRAFENYYPQVNC
ncbi:Hypothetical predicted protein [Paramuricea clavata]|uniref:Uncharacterized protein n=1 Tax=Paramuricea clavata TaxID=317549 RepID=A0A6S7GAP6_PARCT|nr:Hypothetical predicted protein [Paramuricea clavata]